MGDGGRAPDLADEGTPEGAGVAYGAVDVRPVGGVVQAPDLRELGGGRQELTRRHRRSGAAETHSHLEIRYQREC